MNKYYINYLRNLRHEKSIGNSPFSKLLKEVLFENHLLKMGKNPPINLGIKSLILQ
jgi:hypothetical protein